MRDKTNKDDQKGKLVYIKTFGCQMNYYDAEVAKGILEGAGYQLIEDEKAPVDLILLNTCSVREHAEDRVYGRVGAIGKIKKKRPGLLLGLMGCMVEEHGEALFKRFPQIDFMVGTRNIKDLPGLIALAAETRNQVSRIKQDGISIEYTDLIKRSSPYHAWLPIMTGCDKACTFCIVPLTRGAEVSMPAGDVLREARRLVQDGAKWITLLGQNVNSYGKTQAPGLRGPNKTFSAGLNLPFAGHNNGVLSDDPKTNDVSSQDAVCRPNFREDVDFSKLLEMLCQIEGLERISFTTSHPCDATEDLFKVIARQPKISRRFHLPLQSGSDRVLKRMKRLHTYADFKQKVEQLKLLVPNVSITTDIIAGFPGENQDDHEATKAALQELRFDGAFIYKYSRRPKTPASKLKDDVPINIKEARNRELLEIQKRISRENNEKLIGQTVEVFVEGTSPKESSRLLGRSDQEKKIVFPGAPALVGTFQKIFVAALRCDTFIGDLAVKSGKAFC